jgi:hypothetical protein
MTYFQHFASFWQKLEINYRLKNLLSFQVGHGCHLKVYLKRMK